MSALAGVSDAAIAVRDRLRGKIGLTRVRRYRRGTLPDWASDLDDDGDDESIPRAASVHDSMSPRRHPATRDDRRLRRLAEAREELRTDHRCVRLHREVVSAADEEEGEPRDAEVEAAAAEDKEPQEVWRRRIREREEEELPPKEDEELAAESEPGSETEHEADSEEEMCVAVVKPVFLPKPRRDTVVETDCSGGDH